MTDPRQALHVLLGGRYRIDSWLGGGAMGDVYAAEDRTTGRKVAVKLMNERHQGRADALERFRREARAARRVGHEGVVTILDFGVDPDGPPYLVMELLDGESLDATLEREVRLPWTTVRSLGLQLADTLQAAHELGVIHRDLKPSNCFLVHDSGDGVRVKILDFGLAKLFTTAYDARLELTSTGAWLGTLRYMAPEQARDPAQVDPRADLYSLAVILYRLLAGVAPIQGDNELHFLNNLLHAAPRQLVETAPDLVWPVDLEAFFARALAKDPEARFADARRFAAALAAIPPDGVSVAVLPVPPAVATNVAEVDAFDATEPASSRRPASAAELVERVCEQILTRSSLYMDPRTHWESDDFPLPGGTRLSIVRSDLILTDESALLCPVAESGPSPRSLARRCCEFGGPEVSGGLRSQGSLLGGQLYAVEGGRLAAGRILFAAMPEEALTLLRIRELSARFAAQSHGFAVRQKLTAMAVPALFWGALGGGRQMGMVALVEAYAKSLAAAPCPALQSLRLIVPDTGEAIVRAGGELTLDVSALASSPLDQTQRFVLGRYASMRELHNAIWSAIPLETRPTRDSQGSEWNLVVAQTNRKLDPALIDDENTSPAAVGLKHGSRLVLVRT